MEGKLEHNASPFITQISFHKLIETFESIADSDVDYRANYAKALLKEVERVPEFKTGLTDLSLLDNE
jgi:Ni,Fe-hydrogenase III large subunit